MPPLITYFRESEGYSEIAKPDVTNVRFEAMRGLFNGSKKLFVNADGAKEIVQAVAFAKKFGLSLVIVGGNGIVPGGNRCAERQ